jgi:uncharacterized protein YbaP (TraB family)
MKAVQLLLIIQFVCYGICAQSSRTMHKSGQSQTGKPSTNALIQGAKPRFAKSLFWKITPPNSAQASYVYGTMHVSKKIAFNLPDTFYRALQACDVVALESDPEYWLSDMDKPSETKAIMDFMDIGYTRASGSFGFYGASQDVGAITKLQLQSILRRQPSEVNSLLFRSWGLNPNFEESTYLDLFIFKAGKRYGKQIASLEDVSQSTWLSFRAQVEGEKYRKQSAHEQYNQVSNSDIEDAYRMRDIDLLDSLQKKIAPGEGYLQYFLLYRNDSMVSRLTRLHAKGKTVFAAVGAAHLPGERGMLNSLKRQGYKVQPVMFEGNFNPSTKIAELDDMYIPVNFNTYYSRDSSIHFATTAFNQHRNTRRSSTYLSTDMNNGIYYALTRNLTFAALNKQTSAQQLNMLDSLVFENTEGALQSKTSIPICGYPSYRIMSKTQDNQLLYQQIICTPLEIIYQRSAGKTEFMQKQNAIRFLDSLVVEYNHEIQSTHKLGYTKDIDVRMPISIANEGVMKNNFSGTSLCIQGIDVKGGYYSVSRTATDWESSSTEDDTFHLAMFSEALAERAEARLVTSKFIQFAGHSAVKSSYLLRDGSAAEALFLQYGINVYSFVTTVAEASSKADFFSSVRLISESPKDLQLNELKKVGLTMLSSKEPFGQKAIEFYQNAQAYQDLAPDNFGRRWQDMRSYPTSDFGYQANLAVYKLSNFEAWTNLDSFWNHIQLEVFKCTMSVQSRVVTTSPRQCLEVTYKNTNSSIVRRALAVLHDDKIAVMQCVFDSASFAGSTIDTMFSSVRFTSPERCTNYITSGKLDTLKVLSVAKDSIGRKNLLDNYHYMDVLTEEQVAFAHFIDTSGALKENGKLEFDRFVSDLEPNTDSLRGILARIYSRVDESGDIQESLLEQFSRQKSQEASKLFIRLLAEEPPLEGGANSFNSYSDFSGRAARIFSVYFDSLELATALMPELLQLLDYDEYRTKAIELIAGMLLKNLIQPQDIETRLPVFVQYYKRKFRELLASKSRLDEYLTLLSKAPEPGEEQDYGQQGNASYTSNSLAAVTSYLGGAAAGGGNWYTTNLDSAGYANATSLNLRAS